MGIGMMRFSLRVM